MRTLFRMPGVLQLAHIIMISSQLLVSKTGYLQKDLGELISLAQCGSHSAFEEIYRSHLGRVYAICLRILADRAWAEDVAQQVFIRAWTKLNSFRGESSFSSWLYRVAVNLVLGELNSSGRRGSRTTVPEEPPHSLVPCGEAPRNLRLDLEKAISSLPRQARAIFVLHDIEGYKHEEIAEAMGLAVGTCKAQLSRARRLLREVLGT